jgi:DNA repair ATPase RecN
MVGRISLSLKIKIYGFQSIKNPIEIVIDGYSTIEGESNLGKSAVIRAIHAALSNRMGTEFITEDAPACEVSIESLGRTITWHKDRKSTFYEVDGVKINKPGKGTVPDEVRAAGLYAIKTLDKEIHWPQIHFQWEQPFIIGSYTDTLAAELLGASQDTVKIGRAIKLVNADVSQYKTKTDFLEKQHKELTTTVDKMGEIAATLNALQQTVDQIEIVRNNALKTESTYQGLVEKYRSSWSNWRVSSTATKASVPGTLDVSSHERLTDVFRRYTQAYFLVEFSSKNKGIIPEVLDGREYITEITRLYQEINRVSQQIRIMDPVVSLLQVQRPDGQTMVNRVSSLKSLQGQFLKVQREVDSHARVNGEISTELKKIDGEREKIKHLVGSIERCPLCSSPMKDGVYCSDEAHHGRSTQDQGAPVGVAGRSSPTVS